MLSIEKWFVARLNIIVALLLFVCLGDFVNGSFYDEKQSTEYTVAKLNITYCDTFGKKCFLKPYNGNGKFGLHSPKHGSTGWLYSLVDNNVNGCKEFNVKVDRTPWIALIERGVCNFEKKIKNAYKHNATAVIIYDHKESKDAITMSHINADYIVAVSITKTLGEDLARALVNRTKAVFVEIAVGDSLTDNKWRVNPTSVLFVSVSFIVLMVISLAWLVFYYVQRFRYVHARDKTEKRLTSAAKKAITKLPTRTVNKKTEDDETDNCAVCLDGYKASDVVRILPCQHEFHKLCIDPWLVEHRTCPMCKLNILKELGVPSDESRTHDVEVGTSELQEEDHHTAADNPGVVMNEIEPSVTERRPSSDTSESSSVSGSGRVLHVSAEVNWEREDQSSSTSNLVEHPNLRA